MKSIYIQLPLPGFEILRPTQWRLPLEEATASEPKDAPSTPPENSDEVESEKRPRNQPGTSKPRVKS